MLNTSYNAPPEVGRIGSRALIAGIVGLAALAVGFFLDRDQFFRAYLVGFVYWIGAALGCLGFLMIQYLTGGTWGVVTRRIFEAGARTVFPLGLILFVPVVLGMSSLYHWSHADAVAADPILQQKQPYLNVPFFLIRTGVYFLVWWFLASTLSRLSKTHDESGDHAKRQRMADWSGPGVLAYGLTMTFAAFDWVMSLDPHWYSTIYGLMMIAGQGITAIGLTIVVAVYLSRREPMDHVFRSAHFHDLGMLLFALVMLWAYFNYSQLVIIWAANLPEETPWYIRRWGPPWSYLSWSLLIAHFALPFSILLSRDLKKHGKRLIWVAALLLIMRFLDLVWLVAPDFKNSRLSGLWMYAAATVGVGGIWLWFFCRYLQSRSLVPVHDPQLEAALTVHSH